jgi:hypothetical protein
MSLFVVTFKIPLIDGYPISIDRGKKLSAYEYGQMICSKLGFDSYLSNQTTSIARVRIPTSINSYQEVTGYVSCIGLGYGRNQHEHLLGIGRTDEIITELKCVRARTSPSSTEKTVNDGQRNGESSNPLSTDPKNNKSSSK